MKAKWLGLQQWDHDTRAEESGFFSENLKPDNAILNAAMEQSRLANYQILPPKQAEVFGTPEKCYIILFWCFTFVFFSDKYFGAVTCFLFFNMFALVGNVLSLFVQKVRLSYFGSYTTVGCSSETVMCRPSSVNGRGWPSTPYTKMGHIQRYCCRTILLDADLA